MTAAHIAVDAAGRVCVADHAIACEAHVGFDVTAAAGIPPGAIHVKTGAGEVFGSGA